jgi:transaldolase/glucose-6-phosphate isomerase
MIPAYSLARQKEPLFERQRWHLPVPLDRYLGEAMEDWRLEGKTRRLWQGDASLWTGRDEGDWLGWLTIAEDQLGELDGLLKAVGNILLGDFEQVLLLGMGGSSLCPAVLATTFGRLPLNPQLLVLDSTDPMQINRVATQLDFRKTLFVVSSKSGTTLEPILLKDYFWDETKKVFGADLTGSRFVAITDPNSPLQKLAETQYFRHIFFGSPAIGGRYSALSNFGMVPGALMGLDVGTFLARTLHMVHSCRPDVLLEENPGLMLGLILGVAGNHGRDKITIVTSPGIRSLCAWIEQLLAESIGKAGKGLIPIADEELGIPGVYRQDRLFCYIRQKDAADPAQDVRMDVIEQAGQPVVRIDFCDKYDLGQEFFRWEIATATAGSLLGINPFDQPDVEASKIAARQLVTEYETGGALSEEKPLADGNGLKLFADRRNAAELTRLTYGQTSIPALLSAHLQRLKFGDYFALLAFVDMHPEFIAILDAIRTEVRDQCWVATCLSFGPRYLHSTGQIHKGGPNTGVFVEVTHDHSNDLPIPGHQYSFGIVETAQARGDFNVLADHHRRILRVHLGSDFQRGLTAFRDQMFRILK